MTAAVFTGDRTGEAPLTWGQRAIWKAVDQFAPNHGWLNICRLVALPRRAPSDVDSVARAVGAFVSRHESLRTRITSRDGERCQMVYGTGSLPLSVSSGDPQSVLDALGATPYDYLAEWPLRVTLVTDGAVVTHLAIVYSHCAVDFHAAEMITRELRLMLLRGRVPGAAGLQTFDVAERQRDADRRRTFAALDHWLAAYDRLPRSMFGPSVGPGFRRALLVSPALDAAVRLVAARNGVSTSTVLLAAAGGLLAAAGDHDVCGLHTMVHNRFLDGYADAVAKLNQTGLITLDVADRPDFAALLPRAWQAALRGYRHAYYDPLVVDRALTEIGRPVGSGLEPWCMVNDLRAPGDTEQPGPLTDESAIRGLLPQTTLTWPETLDRFAWRFRLQILDAPDGLGLSVTSDLPESTVETFLRDVEALVVRAAFHPVPWPYST